MSTVASQLFGRSQLAAEDQEQLLKLFWNRAELKKQFDRLRDESASLAEQLRKQEALTLRIQQRLDQLEAALANPETAQRALTYYQLRGIWSRCHERIASLAGDLERTCRDRESREQQAAFRSELDDALAGVQGEAARVGQVAADLTEQIGRLRDTRSRRSGFWNFYARRRLTNEIRDKRIEKKLVSQRLGELTEEIRTRSEQEPPSFDGLSVEARRVINLRAIAYAQELYLRFADEELANLARDAASRDLQDVRYGSRRDARMLAASVEQSLQALEGDKGLLKRVQLRAKLIGRRCEYRNEADTVPMAASLGGIVHIDGDGAPGREVSSVNVLVDEYWDIFSVLL